MTGVQTCALPILTDDMNRQLSAEFKECEVHEALTQMAPLKAPGPDGMPPLFFQHFWGLVDDSLLFCRSNVEECQKVLDVLQTYEMSLGQQINKAKTTVFYSKSTKEDQRDVIKNMLGVTEI